MTASFCPACGNRLETRTQEGRTRQYCTSCSRIIWQNPKPVAWTLVEHEDDLLLVRRAQEPDSGTWDIPGGFLEHGESFRQAAVRELEEETDLSINHGSLTVVDTLSFMREDEHVVGAVFHHTVGSRPSILAGSDAAEARFASVDEWLEHDALREDCRPVLERLSS
ncbi:MAG: NUDIX hydrolase [Candidatus Nanohaloarchaea archaeon]|nr:NUDIX hydrolase [Candidatus Nanohaloarchaea archaeon]